VEGARSPPGRAGGPVMKRLFAAVVLLCAASAWALAPAGEGGKWWKNTRVVRELDLSDAQVDRIEAIFLRVRPALIDLRADLEKKRLLQESAMDRPTVDAVEAERRIDEVEQARSKLEKTRAMMFLEIRQVLTPEQRRKARELLEERRERLGPRSRPR